MRSNVLVNGGPARAFDLAQAARPFDLDLARLISYLRA